MAQVDRRAAASGEFIGKDVFLKSFQQQSGNISASQLTSLVSTVQSLNLSILKVGSFTAGTSDTVKMIVEGADNLANGDISAHVIADVSF
tara:strand:+ start:796 stop:1065 length:270 start_codon:yes stop_codon:yes gene_type:complete